VIRCDRCRPALRSLCSGAAELQDEIDPSELPPDLEGSLIFDHTDTMRCMRFGGPARDELELLPPAEAASASARRTWTVAELGGVLVSGELDAVSTAAGTTHFALTHAAISTEPWLCLFGGGLMGRMLGRQLEAAALRVRCVGAAEGVAEDDAGHVEVALAELIDLDELDGIDEVGALSEPAMHDEDRISD
jgi:hypothetical protein